MPSLFSVSVYLCICVYAAFDKILIWNIWTDCTSLLTECCHHRNVFKICSEHLTLHWVQLNNFWKFIVKQYDLCLPEKHMQNLLLATVFLFSGTSREKWFKGGVIPQEIWFSATTTSRCMTDRPYFEEDCKVWLATQEKSKKKKKKLYFTKNPNNPTTKRAHTIFSLMFNFTQQRCAFLF